jgi:hypothetical protein
MKQYAFFKGRRGSGLEVRRQKVGIIVYYLSAATPYLHGWTIYRDRPVESRPGLQSVGHISVSKVFAWRVNILITSIVQGPKKRGENQDGGMGLDSKVVSSWTRRRGKSHSST